MAAATWQNVTPGPDLLPDWALISIIEPSRTTAGTAYVAATRYKSHDIAPYLFKTDDYGTTWTTITNGIPGDDFTRVIREDSEGPALRRNRAWAVRLVRRGDNWQSLQLNLPVVPIHDLVIAQGDLVVGTHGRSFWVLDDISPLRQLATGAVTENGTILYAPRASKRWASRPGSVARPFRDATSARRVGCRPASRTSRRATARKRTSRSTPVTTRRTAS